MHTPSEKKSREAVWMEWQYFMVRCVQHPRSAKRWQWSNKNNDIELFPIFVMKAVKKHQRVWHIHSNWTWMSTRGVRDLNRCVLQFINLTTWIINLLVTLFVGYSQCMHPFLRVNAFNADSTLYFAYNTSYDELSHLQWMFRILTMEMIWCNAALEWSKASSDRIAGVLLRGVWRGANA